MQNAFTYNSLDVQCRSEIDGCVVVIVSSSNSSSRCLYHLKIVSTKITNNNSSADTATTHNHVGSLVN